MRAFLHSRRKSFRYAFAGVGYTLRTQRNTWIHLVFTILILVVGAALRLPAGSFAALMIVIGMVWLAELFNTAIEAVVDLLSPQVHPAAKIAKDVGAAAVLIAAFTSVLVGILVLGPPLWAWFQSVILN